MPPATEPGLARIASPDFLSIIANYVAALCLNVDMTLFRGIQSALAQFTEIENSAVVEHLEPATGSEAIRQRIDSYAEKRATTARALNVADRKALIQALRKSMDTAAQHLGISRATACLYARQENGQARVPCADRYRCDWSGGESLPEGATADGLIADDSGRRLHPAHRYICQYQRADNQ